MNKLLIPLLPIFLAACGGESGDTGNMAEGQSGAQDRSLSVADAVTTAGAMMAVAIAENNADDSAAIEAVNPPSKGVVTTDYEDALYGMGGYYGATPRGFLQRQLDPASEGGLLNRFNQTVSEKFCLLSQLLPATDGVVNLAPDGAVLTLDATSLTGMQAEQIQTACPRLKPDTLRALADQAPLNVHYRVEDVSAQAGSQYERKVSVGWNQNTYSDFTYFAIGSEQLRLLTVQTNPLRPGKGSSYAALVSDPVSGVIRFESHSLHLGSQADRHDVYRVYANTVSQESLVLARSNSDRLNSDTMVAVARSVAQAPLIVSFDIDAAAAIRDLNVCADRTDLSLIPAQAPDCAGMPVFLASGFTAADQFTSAVKADFAQIDQSASLRFDSLAGLLIGPPVN